MRPRCKAGATAAEADFEEVAPFAIEQWGVQWVIDAREWCRLACCNRFIYRLTEEALDVGRIWGDLPCPADSAASGSSESRT